MTKRRRDEREREREREKDAWRLSREGEAFIEATMNEKRSGESILVYRQGYVGLDISGQVLVRAVEIEGFRSGGVAR